MRKRLSYFIPTNDNLQTDTKKTTFSSAVTYEGNIFFEKGLCIWTNLTRALISNINNISWSSSKQMRKYILYSATIDKCSTIAILVNSTTINRLSLPIINLGPVENQNSTVIIIRTTSLIQNVFCWYVILRVRHEKAWQVGSVLDIIKLKTTYNKIITTYTWALGVR